MKSSQNDDDIIPPAEPIQVNIRDLEVIKGALVLQFQYFSGKGIKTRPLSREQKEKLAVWSLDLFEKLKRR